MGEATAIEWTDHTFNPWIGCTKVGPGCDHCYAETQNAFRKWNPAGWGPHASRRRTGASYWRAPLKWDRDAAAAGVRRRVFCASLADVFDNHGSITSGWRGDLWHLIDRTPHLTWMLLTKRPGNIPKMLPDGYGAPAWGGGWPNVWMGCTIVNQPEADRDISKILAVPAAIYFLSVEPMLGPVVLPTEFLALGRRALVIAGGESGPRARPMHPDWPRSLRDQCAAAGVPFFFKQWGEWAPAPEGDDNYAAHRARGARDLMVMKPDFVAMELVGNVRAGRLLDGREWNETPSPDQARVSLLPPEAAGGGTAPTLRRSEGGVGGSA